MPTHSQYSHICTFVPGEAVLSAPSDVGHCQDPSKVSNIEQVSNTDHRQDRQQEIKPLQTKLWGIMGDVNIHFLGCEMLYKLHL